MENLIKKIDEILIGIDKTERQQYEGWWPDSFGAEFGAEKLEEIHSVIREHFNSQVAQQQKPPEPTQ